MLMSGASAGLKALRALPGDLMIGRASRRERRFRRGAVDLSYPFPVIPHRGAGKAFIQQHACRGQGIPVAIEGRKEAGGIFAIAPMKPDFIALHGRPLSIAGSMLCAERGLSHCAMLRSRFLFRAVWPARNFRP